MTRVRAGQGRHSGDSPPAHAPRAKPRYRRSSGRVEAPADTPLGLRSQWRRAWASRKAGEVLLSKQFRMTLRHDLGDLSELRRVGRRPPLREYITELWDRRYFIYAGARGEAVTRYSNERLGAAWYIIRPLLDAAFYLVIFGFILDVGSRMPNYIAFVIVGIFMFQLTARAITGGVSLIRNSKAMIRAFAFPKAGLAISFTVRELLSSMPAMGVMVVMVMAIPPHAIPNVAWLALPGILAVQVVMNLGLTLLFGWLGAAVPDLAQAMSFFSRFLMYGSAVIFPIERFIDQPAILAVIEANPIYQLLEAYRTVILDGTFPLESTWIMIGCWALGLLLLGSLCFWADEDRYGRA